MIRVLVVDDYEPFCHLAKLTLEKDEDFQVVATAATGDQAVKLAEDLRPDLVLMDMRLPGMSGLEATEQILKQRPDTKVVLISMDLEREYSCLAKQIGALAFIAKPDLEPKVLRQILAETVRGEKRAQEKCSGDR